MVKKIITAVSAAAITCAASAADPADLPVNIGKLHAVQMFPAISQRAEWDAFQKDARFQKFREKTIKDAEKLLNKPILELPATKFMEFVRNGNRRRYEAFYFERRNRLETLFLAEAFEYKGRFIDRLIDEIWAILNESTWCLPAHNGMGHYLDEKDAPGMDDPLSYYGYEIMDLFSAETSAYVSTVYALAYDELKKVSPGLVHRMRDVLKARTVQSLDTFSGYWWTKGANNWTPWICSNLMCAANNLFADDPEELTRFVKTRLQPCMDNFMQKYPADGGCDEGPSYWNVSPVRAMIYFEYLYRQSDGKISIYDSEKFKRMSEYIADVIFGDGYVVDFADSPSRLGNLSLGFLTLFAKHAKSEKLREFCLSFRAKHPVSVQTHSSIIQTLGELFFEETGKSAKRGDFYSWFEKLQVLSVQSGRINFAAKGGTNHENHNHNDVGQFILAADGMPFVVDLGNTEYTRDTFSSRRYENPIINSMYHNVPAFSGNGQSFGQEFAAKDVEFKKEGDVFRITMELAGTYRKELGIRSCKREILLNTAEKTLVVTDEWKTKKPMVYSVTLFTTSAPDAGPYDVKTAYPLTTEPFEITDASQKKNWKALWKSVLSAPEGTAGKNTLTFTLK